MAHLRDCAGLPARIHSALFRRGKVLLPFAATVILCVSILEKTFSVPIFFGGYLIIGSLFVHFLTRGTVQKESHRLFVSIYAYNVIVVILFFYAFQFHYGNHYLSGGTDDKNFEYCGRYAARTLKLNGDIVVPQFDATKERPNPERYEKYRGYITIIASIYYLSDMIAGDMHTLNVRMMNSLAIGFIAVIVFLLALRCGLPEDLSFIGAFWAGVYPSQAFWGAVIVRDTLMVFLVIGAVYSFYRLIFDNSPKRWEWLAVVILLIYLISLIRTQSALLLTCVMGLCIIYFIFNKTNIILKPVLLGLYGFSVWLFFNRLSPNIDEFNSIFERQTAYRMQFAQGLSGYVFRLPLVPFGMIIRPLYALISPFPSFSLSTQAVFESIGTIAVILMLPFIFSGFFYSLSERKKAILGIVSSGLIIGVSWTTFQVRHLLAHMPFIFLLAMNGWSGAKQPGKLFVLGLFMANALAMLYVGAKIFIH